MPTLSRHRPFVIGLYLNAALLAAILFALFTRGGGSTLPAAFAGMAPQPIAGSGNIFLMPAQFSINTWGCYIMDTDAQTLCAYQFYPGDKQLRFVAARNFHWDRKLGNFNTTPSWPEVQKLADLEQSAVRANEEKPADTSPENPKEQ